MLLQGINPHHALPYEDIQCILRLTPEEMAGMVGYSTDEIEAIKGRLQEGVAQTASQADHDELARVVRMAMSSR